MKELSITKILILRNSLKIALLFLSLFVLLFISLRYAINDTITNHRLVDEKFITVGISILFGYILAFVVLKAEHKLDVFFDKTLRALRNAIKGNIGEKKTFAQLEKILGGNSRIYKNLKIDPRFDIDAVIVGPKGLIVIEIKNLSGIFRFVGEDTYKISWRYGNECFCRLGEYDNPIREVLRHNLKLEKYLHENGFGNMRSHKTLLMVGDAKIEELKEPAAYVITNLEHLKKYVDGLYDDERFTPEFRERLGTFLNK